MAISIVRRVALYVILNTPLLLLAAQLPASGNATVPEPSGYRMEEYRAPVPETLRGAHVVTTREAADLWRQKGAIFFDVMPHAPKPAKLPAGTIWREKIRKNIPGSTWLPNVGYGALSKTDADYFQAGIDAKTGGDMARKILFYCMTDCWMSWNAAKRALERGHTSVFWYPHGADGWEAEGLPLAEDQPFLLGAPDFHLNPHPASRK
jgi:PQQ-dependent catabolism-associated CXXCW motif protein